MARWEEKSAARAAAVAWLCSSIPRHEPAWKRRFWRLEPNFSRTVSTGKGFASASVRRAASRRPGSAQPDSADPNASAQPVAPPPANAPPLTEQSKLQLLRYVDGEYAKVLTPLPGGKAGYHVKAGSTPDQDSLRKALMSAGAALN